MFNDPFKLKGELIKLIRRYNMNKKIAAAVSSAALVLGSTA